MHVTTSAVLMKPQKPQTLHIYGTINYIHYLTTYKSKDK